MWDDLRMDQHELICQILAAAGGVPPESLLSPGYRGKRADIVFSADRVIAEVKSLTSDRRQDQTVSGKLGEVVAAGAAFGAPIIFGDVTIGLHDLPPTVAERALRVIGSRVQKEVSFARDQIVATRAALGTPDAYGLVVFVAPPQRIGHASMRWLIHDAIERSPSFPGLDGALVIETPLAVAEPFDTPHSYSSLWSISGRPFPPALAVRIAEAWSDVTGQPGHAAAFEQFSSLGATE